MQRASWIGVVFLLPVLASSASALGHPGSLERINRRLAGRIDDHTHNHGADRRIWSSALGEWRDLYVYLPPGFDPAQSYPVMLWLHGVDEDERSFLNERGVDTFDAAIASGKLPPLIIAIPDGTLSGRRPTLFGTNPLWLNSAAGNFRDYLMEDVWTFVLANYPVRPEREAHVLAGFSGGGGAAFRGRLPPGHHVSPRVRSGLRHPPAPERALAGLPRPLLRSL
jgi:enterochelin esterase-like enzyme